MAAVPAGPTHETQPGETVEQRFRRLEAVWYAETCAYSDPAKIMGHPAWKEIIRMGEVVVPLMLRDIEEKPRLWVWALQDITGENPVPDEDAGYIPEMGEAWLRWGKEKGYRW
jgi:hypothetical protein